MTDTTTTLRLGWTWDWKKHDHRGLTLALSNAWYRERVTQYQEACARLQSIQITPRILFAGLAMAGINANPEHNISSDETAKISVADADALLAALWEHGDDETKEIP